MPFNWRDQHIPYDEEALLRELQRSPVYTINTDYMKPILTKKNFLDDALARWKKQRYFAIIHPQEKEYPMPTVTGPIQNLIEGRPAAASPPRVEWRLWEGNISGEIVLQCRNAGVNNPYVEVAKIDRNGKLRLNNNASNAYGFPGSIPTIFGKLTMDISYHG